MACHVTKINNNDKQPTKQKVIILVIRNLKAFKTVDCTCTILSISDKSMFTFAHVWSVCVITCSLLLAFARDYFALISICRKIRKKYRKKWIKYQLKSRAVLFPSKSHMNWEIRKNLNLFEASCSKWLFGGTFKLTYHFLTVLAVILLSIQHNINCSFSGKALNVKDVIKKFQQTCKKTKKKMK